MILTDGENFGKTIDLADGVGIGRYTEISEEEYQAKTKEDEMNE